MLDGVVSPLTNDIVFLGGILTVLLIPPIAMFDMYQFDHIHTPVASAYFIISSLLLLGYSFLMQRHKAQFSPDARDKIDRLTYWAWLEFISFLTLAISFKEFGSHYFVGVYAEWTTVFLTLNYHLALSFENPYFSSITEPGKLVSAPQFVR